MEWRLLAKKKITAPFIPSVTSSEDLSQMKQELLAEVNTSLKVLSFAQKVNVDQLDDPFGDEDTFREPMEVNDGDFMGFTYTPPAPTQTTAESTRKVPAKPSSPPPLAGRKRSQVVSNAKSNKISLDDFEMKKLIGRGSFGKVFLVNKKDSGQVRNRSSPNLLLRYMP